SASRRAARRSRPLPRRPAAGLALVRATEEGERGTREDLQIEPGGTVLDVPNVELDPLGPGQRRAPVDLRPARDPRFDLQPAALALVVLLHLVAERRPRADYGHVSADHVPELRQLVERQPPQDTADPGDAPVAPLDRQRGTLPLRSHD